MPSPAFATIAPGAGACPQCGGPVDVLDRFCPACGATRAPAAEAEEAPHKFFRCQQCGAEVGIDPGQRSYACPFCDSNYVVEFSPERSGRQAPEYVIGFAVTPAAAMERFRQWLGRGWFRPSDLRQSAVADKLKGVYLPFWSFTMLARSQWTASIGEYWYRTETYTTQENGKTVTRTRRVQETEWWELDGRHHQYHAGYLVSGSRGLKQQDAERIQPFRLEALHVYRAQFLAGWLAEEYSIERAAALEICQQEFFRREEDAVAAFLPGDTHRNLVVRTRFEKTNSDLILLPIYVLSYRYGDKLYRFLLNGQTGRAAGDKPISWRKVLWAVLTAVGAIVALALLGRWL